MRWFGHYCEKFSGNSLRFHQIFDLCRMFYGIRFLPLYRRQCICAKKVFSNFSHCPTGSEIDEIMNNKRSKQLLNGFFWWQFSWFCSQKSMWMLPNMLSLFECYHLQKTLSDCGQCHESFLSFPSPSDDTKAMSGFGFFQILIAGGKDTIVDQLK